MPFPRPALRRPRPAAARTGLLIAGALVVLFAALLAAFALIRGPAAPALPSPIPFDAPPDIKSLPSGNSPMSRMGSGAKFFLQVVDEQDPTILTAELTADRSEPLEGKRYRLDRPRAWTFLKDGRTIHVQADTGLAYVPDESSGAKPREGLLEGHVVLRLFRALPDRRRPDPEADAPLVTVVTSTLRFDGALGEVTLPDDFTITSDEVLYEGRALTILFNEVQERLESLHVASTRLVTYTPRPSVETPPAPADSGAGQTTDAAPTAAAMTSPPPTLPPDLGIAGESVPPGVVETTYRLVCEGGVVIAQTGRELTAERLEGWARLVDNSLRPGAIASFTDIRPLPADAPPDGGAISPPDSPAPAQDAPPVNEPEVLGATPADPITNPVASSDPITIRWSGPLDVRPLPAPVLELAHNDFFLRLTAPPGAVRFADAESRAVATGDALEYAATRREGALEAAAPLGATIDAPDSGVARARRFELSLATGRIHVPSAGVIAAVRDASPTDLPASNRTLAWASEADFDFAVEAGRVTTRLAEVRAQGDVELSDGVGSLAGDSLTAAFARVDRDRSVIARLVMLGGARGRDGAGGTLAGDTLSITFADAATLPTPDAQPDPTLLVATGDVRAERDDASLAARHLEATLGRVDGNLAATGVVATGDVAYAAADGATARGDALRADPVTQVADLDGAPAVVARQDVVIRSANLRFDGLNRTLNVPVAGELEHVTPATDNAPTARALATWTGQMTYDDRRGTAECLGDARVESVQGVLSRDTLEAHRIRLQLSPDEAETGDAGTLLPATSPAAEISPDDPAADVIVSAPATAATDTPGVPRSPRRLLNVVAFAEEPAAGASPDAAAPPPAKIEVRRYAPATEGEPAVLDRLLYLEGRTIRADNDLGTLDVPGAGVLLALDRRATESAPASPEDAPPSTGLLSNTAQGLSKFTWEGFMILDRPRGTVTMSRAVRLEHRPLGETDVTELECERLTANIREAADVSADAAGGADPNGAARELRSAAADGAVWLRSAGKELVADSLLYDAVRRLIDARADPEGSVTIYDPAAAAPTTAARILWDLATDRVEVQRAGAVTVPR